MTTLAKTTKTLGSVAAALMLAGLLTGCAASGAEERRGSIYDWQRDPTPENRQLIRALLDDANRDVRATALNVLVGLDAPDADTLAIDGLQDEDGFVRSIAAKLLGDLGNVESANLLVAQLLEDPDPRARQTAAEALTLLGGDVSIAGLVQGLVDPMKEVRLAAVRGVRELAPGRARGALARILLEDPEWEIRVQAAGGLGKSGDREMVPVLRRALGDESEFVRSAAANALKALGQDVPSARAENRPGR